MVAPDRHHQRGAGDTAYGDEAETPLPAVTAGPVRQTLPAVAQGRVERVSDDAWMLGIGPLAAQVVLDDLERTLPAG